MGQRNTTHAVADENMGLNNIFTAFARFYPTINLLTDFSHSLANCYTAILLIHSYKLIEWIELPLKYLAAWHGCSPPLPPSERGL